MGRSILILVYEQFAEFEVTALGFVARQENNDVVTCGLDGHLEVTGMGGLKVLADIPLSAVEVDKYAALVIPGGMPDAILQRPEVSQLIMDFHRAGKVVAAICLAPLHLAKAGVLAGRQYTTSAREDRWGYFDWSLRQDRPVVVDGTVVTALGSAFVEFSLTVLGLVGGFRRPEHLGLWRTEFGVSGAHL
ncbi:MAG: DJ-1/PfpI family protein [Bacillota bacterium]|nr:DJ-1/PfpI family protein [Bacillota bacterium]